MSPGEQVQVKLAPGLGSWVDATVISVEPGCCGKGSTYLVQVRGRDAKLPARQVRRPRGVRAPQLAPAPKVARPKRNDQRVVGRGPLRFPKFRVWVKSKLCIFCHRESDDPHHYGTKGMGQTTDDTRLTPVCRKAHDALHHRRVDELCGGAGVESWAAAEVYIYRKQMDFVTEFLRFNDGVMS